MILEEIKSKIFKNKSVKILSSLNKLIKMLHNETITDGDVVKILNNLIMYGATTKDIESVTYGIVPFLCAASERGYIKTVAYLIDNLRCDINLVGSCNSSPLMYASWGNSVKIVEALIKRKALLDLQNDYNITALMYACNNGSLEIVDMLVSNGALLDLQDNDGSTALIIASERGYDKVVDILLQNGANINIKDNEGKTAYDYALEMNYLNICEMIDCIKDENANIVVKSSEEVEDAVSKLAKKLRGVK